MYSSTIALFVLSQLASVRAQATAGFDVLSSPASGASFSVGSVLPIVWAPESSTGTVSIMLNGGSSPSTLNHLFVIGSSIKSQDGGYNWTITSAVGAFAAYGLNLTLDGGREYQESNPFHITGGSETSSSSSSSVISSSSSSTSSLSSAVSESTVTASTTTVATTSKASSLTSSGTVAVTTLTSSATLTSPTMTPFSNGTASKTSSAQSSGTSSAAKSSSTSGANGSQVQFLSASAAALGACLFAFAL